MLSYLQDTTTARTLSLHNLRVSVLWSLIQLIVDPSMIKKTTRQLHASARRLHANWHASDT